MPSPRRVLFFRTHLADGGADRVTLTLLHHLDRARYTPSLALVRREGELLGEVPADVPVIDLAARRVALAAPALAATIRALEPDVVVCTAGGANVIAVVAHRLARSKARLVLSERNAIHRDVVKGRVRSVIERALKRIAYRLADEVTAVSDGVARDLVSGLGVPPSRVSVVYNPVVHDRQTAQAAEALDHPWFTDGKPTVLAVGRLVEQKDYPTMLAAFARIRETASEARLAILGKGPELAALETRAREIGLTADSIQFLGFDPNPFRYMARARVLLQSSRAEGLPGTIIQSMACGTPVVSTDCDHGPREVIRDGIDGFLVPVGDADSLADRATRLLRDDSMRARFSAAAQASAQRFSVAESLRRYEAAIIGTPS
jgi:glycosyltransferase involved in cell wall biosynthesis